MASGKTPRIAHAGTAPQGGRGKAHARRKRPAANGSASASAASPTSSSSQDGKQILVSLSGKLYVVDRADGDSPRAEDRARHHRRSRSSRPDGKRSPTSATTTCTSTISAHGKETARHHRRHREEDARPGRVRRPGRDGPHSAATGGRPIATIHRLRGSRRRRRRNLVRRRSHPSRATPQPFFYPRPGKANVKVRLGIVPGERAATTIWIEWDTKKYPYLATCPLGQTAR